MKEQYENMHNVIGNIYFLYYSPFKCVLPTEADTDALINKAMGG